MACCGDEVYKQTIMAAFPTLYARRHRQTEGEEHDDNREALRLIDWRRGKPYTWTMEDLPALLNSQMMFARKFSDEHLDVVRAVREKVGVKN